jgi:hypothetical protein
VKKAVKKEVEAVLEQRDPAGLSFGRLTDEFGLEGAGSFVSPSRDVTRHVALCNGDLKPGKFEFAMWDWGSYLACRICW